ncbi:hypothetical protein [Streptomyces sp. L2]|uniref:hypothetical protein n=1 Tax=Streptomyces sp. L2 TaxID=2162665 RepID=UPI0010116AB3|nr:hypothetical protein [Streptomyces sp. L2]
MGDETPRSAFDDPGTLRAWQRARRQAIATTAFWVLSLPGFFVAATLLWESQVGGSLPVYIIGAWVLVAVIGIAVSDSRRVQLKTMRGILATYPWQEHPALDGSGPPDITCLKLPNPDDRDKAVSVAVRRYGLSGRRWRSAVAHARAQGFRYAGDPRFAAVIALRGVEELGAARPTHALAASRGARPDLVSESAWRRARAAGISGESPFTEEQQQELRAVGKRDPRA